MMLHLARILITLSNLSKIIRIIYLKFKVLQTRILQNSIYLYTLYVQILQLNLTKVKMNRRFLRPLFSFWDPFFAQPVVVRKFIPSAVRKNRALQYQEKKQVEDPNETFDNFFKEYCQNTSSLKAEQKQFFEKHFPEKFGKKFDPYLVLGIDKNADIQKVKQAYRVNALKYHPKNDTSQAGQKKFQDISRAYNQLIKEKKSNDYGEDVSTKSLFEDFHKELQSLNKVEEKQNGKQKVKEQKTETKGNGKEQNKKLEKTNLQNHQDYLKGAELYSESSYFEYVNGKKKLNVTKMYEKDGKTIKVNRVQESKNDGTIEVTETLDDGKQVKNKKFVQGKKQQNYLGN